MLHTVCHRKSLKNWSDQNRSLLMINFYTMEATEHECKSVSCFYCVYLSTLQRKVTTIQLLPSNNLLPTNRGSRIQGRRRGNNIYLVYGINIREGKCAKNHCFPIVVCSSFTYLQIQSSR